MTIAATFDWRGLREIWSPSEDREFLGHVEKEYRDYIETIFTDFIKNKVNHKEPFTIFIKHGTSKTASAYVDQIQLKKAYDEGEPYIIYITDGALRNPEVNEAIIAMDKAVKEYGKGKIPEEVKLQKKTVFVMATLGSLLNSMKHESAHIAQFIANKDFFGTKIERKYDFLELFDLVREAHFEYKNLLNFIKLEGEAEHSAAMQVYTKEMIRSAPEDYIEKRRARMAVILKKDLKAITELTKDEILLAKRVLAHLKTSMKLEKKYAKVQHKNAVKEFLHVEIPSKHKEQLAKARKELIAELQGLASCLKEEHQAEDRDKRLRYVWGRIMMQVLTKSKQHSYTHTGKTMYDRFTKIRTYGMIGRKEDLERLVKLSEEIVKFTDDFLEKGLHAMHYTATQNE